MQITISITPPPKKTKDITFLDNDQVQNAEIGINNATTDRLALALASPAGTVAGVPLAEQQTYATIGQHTLLHGETLFVVASADAHYVALQEERNQIVTFHFKLRHVHEMKDITRS